MDFYGAGLARIIAPAVRPAARRPARRRCSATNWSRACWCCTTCTPRTAAPASRRALERRPGTRRSTSGVRRGERHAAAARRRRAAAAAARARHGRPGRRVEAALACFAPEVSAVELESRRGRAEPALLQIGTRHRPGGAPMTARDPGDRAARPGLRRFLHRAAPQPERCELCAVDGGQADHRHLVDTEQRALACACTALRAAVRPAGRRRGPLPHGPRPLPHRPRPQRLDDGRVGARCRSRSASPSSSATPRSTGWSPSTRARPAPPRANSNPDAWQARPRRQPPGRAARTRRGGAAAAPHRRRLRVPPRTRSTSATNSSAGCACCGRASTAEPRPAPLWTRSSRDVARRARPVRRGGRRP